MKKHAFVLFAALLALSLAGCGEAVPAPTSAPALLLVESKPTEAPTVPETREETLPPFIRPAETVPQTETAPETTASTLPKPIVTKSPTGETVKAGEEAWFVARGEEAQGIRWWFTPPEGGEAKNAADTAALFPELTMEGSQEDTLILRNLPLALTGWTIRGEYYNASGSVFTDPAILTVEPAVGPVYEGPVPQGYGPVLENCRFVQRYDPSQDSAESLGQNDLYQLYDGRELLGAGLGYALQDLNGDGTPELILGCPGDNGFGPLGGEMVFAIFTLSGNSPVKLVQSWARNRHYLAENGRLYAEGSSGAAFSTFGLYKIGPTALEGETLVWSDSEDGQSVIFYLSSTGVQDPAAAQRIGEQRFYELQSQLLGKKQPLPPLTPIPW